MWTGSAIVDLYIHGRGHFGVSFQACFCIMRAYNGVFPVAGQMAEKRRMGGLLPDTCALFAGIASPTRVPAGIGVRKPREPP